MKEESYIFFRTFYDKELLRMAVLILDRENILYKLIDRSHTGSSRAPLGGYIEADIMVPQEDFERVTDIFKF